MSASAVLKLQKVGFTAEQVEALVDFMDTQAASKADITEGRAGLSELKAELRRLGSAIELLKHDLTIRLGGMMVVAVGVILAAIRYLPPPHP